MNAVDIALKTPELSTLVQLLKAAGLVETVRNLYDKTIFAPTNGAFAKLPKEVVQDLLRPQNLHQLRTVLLTHIAHPEIFSDEISNGSSAHALSGAVLEFHKYMGSVFVSAPKSSAKVVRADIEADNVIVIHLIDTVLLP